MKVRKLVPGHAKLYEWVDGIPCPNKGTPTGEKRPCVTCGGRIEVPLLSCSLHGTCSEDHAVTDADGKPVKCCLICNDRPAATSPPLPPSPPPSPPPPAAPPPGRSESPRIAPKEVGWNGEGKRPWHYDVTVCMAHLGTVSQLQLAMDLWRCSLGVVPYFVVVDTGSSWDDVMKLERVRAPDCEIHYIRSHAYNHSSGPVTAALDLVHSLCQTDVLFHTHTDVFPLRREFLFWLKSQCSETQPVVGWQMSSRGGTEEWKKCVSHTATVIHMPTARKRGLTWSMQRYYADFPEDLGKPTVGWPDTESPFYLAMKKEGIVPRILGPEANFQRHFLEADGIKWADHARSYTGLKITDTDPRWGAAVKRMADAEREARERLKQWRSS